MEKLRRLMIRHFELIVILVIIGAMFVIDHFIQQKITFINFYFIPVLLAGYAYGKRMAGLTALFCIAAVLFCLIYDPSGDEKSLKGFALGAGLLLEQKETATESPVTAESPLLMEKRKPPKDKARTIKTYDESLTKDTERRVREVWFRDLRWAVYTHVAAWGGFLFLSGVIVGALAEEKERRLNDLRTAYIGVLEILSNYLETADKYMKGHLMRVSVGAAEVAKKLGMQTAEVEYVHASALLHDMARLHVSIDLIQRAASLSAIEKERMNEETQPGGELLMKMGAVLNHSVPILTATDFLRRRKEEKMREGDEQLKAEGIPLGAQIVDLVDTFDTLTSVGGKSPQEAFDEIEKSPVCYDEKVLSAAKQVMISLDLGGKD